MRYGAIAPLVTGLDDRYPSMQAYYEEVSAKGLTGPDGRNHHFAPSTIERWYLDYKKHGFDSLIPAARADAGKSRKLDHDIQAAELGWGHCPWTGIRINRLPLSKAAGPGKQAVPKQGHAPL